MKLLQLIQTYAQTGDGDLEAAVVNRCNFTAKQANCFGKFAAVQGILFGCGQASAYLEQISFDGDRLMPAVDHYQEGAVVALFAQCVKAIGDGAQYHDNIVVRCVYTHAASRQCGVLIAQLTQLCVPVNQRILAVMEGGSVERIAEAVHTGFVAVVDGWNTGDAEGQCGCQLV